MKTYHKFYLINNKFLSINFGVLGFWGFGFLDKWKKANGMGSQTLSPSDLYTLVFLPDYADKPDTYVFATKSNDPLLYWK